jgi:peptide chain release factor subunit 1
VPIANRSSSKRTSPKRTSGTPHAGAHAATLTPLIERLTALGATEHWVVSCYLKLEPRDRGRGKYLIKLKNRIKLLTAGLEARGLSRGARLAVERDLERIREHLAHPSNLPAGRGIALFACEPLGLFEAIPLPVVFRSRLVVDHTPLVRELAALNDEFGRVLCVAYDRTSARFLEVTPTGATELSSLAAGDTTRAGRFHGPSRPSRPHGRGVGASAPGEHGFNQRIREEKQRHYAQIAQRLFEVTRELPVQGIVLAGMGADVGAVEPHLHPYVREFVLGTVRLNPKSASPADVLAAVLDVRRERERAWEQRHVQELAEGLGAGWAVDGLEATLGALARGQVRTLLVDPSVEHAGFRCATGRLAVTEDACGGGGAVPVPDVVDEAIEDALRQGAHVDVVEDDGARQRVDGLAALLRFKLG